MGIDHVCLIAMSVYGDDNRSIVDALERQQGKGRAVVCIDPRKIKDEELDRLHRIGARGVRINLKTFGKEPRKDDLISMLQLHANKIKRLGWVMQVFISLHQFPLIAEEIPKLEVPVVIDHLGFPSEKSPVQQQTGYKELMDALSSDHIWIKLSGTYRFPHVPNLESYVKEVLQAAPHRIVWASDWPHSGSTENNPGGDRFKHQEYRKVDDIGFLRRCIDWCDGNESVIRKIWVDNPRRLWQHDQ